MPQVPEGLEVLDIYQATSGGEALLAHRRGMMPPSLVSVRADVAGAAAALSTKVELGRGARG
jgi:hypothetical protein